jgi:hypothetical protein
VSFACRTSHTLVRLAVLLAIVAFLAGSEVRAEKLVVFKNGKAIRVKTVSQERGWARLELEGGAVLGVRSSQISVVDDAGNSTVGKLDAVQNQASVGGAGGYVPPAYNAPPPDNSDNGGNDEQPVPPENEVQQPGQVAIPGGALVNPSVPGARPFNNQPVSGLGGIGGRRPGSGLMPSSGRQQIPSGSLFNRRGTQGQQQQTQDSDSN